MSVKVRSAGCADISLGIHRVSTSTSQLCSYPGFLRDVYDPGFPVIGFQRQVCCDPASLAKHLELFESASVLVLSLSLHEF